jgi:glycosyltransferase involved in cell wall biosynthesis
MMRCLWITRQDPRSADSGELIYTQGLLQSLSRTPGIDLHVLAHSAEHPNPAARDGIRWHLPGPTPPKRALGVISRLPGDADRLGNPMMRAELRSLLVTTPWDWIVIDQAACGWALDEIPAGFHGRIAYIAHNHEATVRAEVASDQSGSLPLRMALRRDAAKYARLERAIVERADLVTAITPRDQAAFLREFPGKQSVVLPPGYDGHIPAGDTRPIDPDTPRRVVLAGTFLWIAKRRNLEHFLAAAADPFRLAKIDFLVVGKADPAYFERLAGEYPWARFHANVPSMDPWLEYARIGLIPEALGGGFKLKALDYIFRGLPLASVEDALSGLPLVPGADAITATNPAALANAVARCINEDAFLNLAARSALAKCRHAFDWEGRGRLLAEYLHYPASQAA